MAKAGRFWVERASEYSNEECNQVSNTVVASINQYLKDMRADDYKYLAEQKGLSYFRDALASGEVVINVEGIVSYLKNIKNKEEVKTKIHDVVNEMKEVSFNFSDEYKADHKADNALEIK